MGILTRNRLWKGIPTPDFYMPLTNNTASIIDGTPGIYNPGVAGDPSYTNVLGGSARSMFGLDCNSTNKARVDVGSQVYSGATGTMMIAVLPGWSWNDGAQHVFAMLGPIDATALSGVIIEKSSANQVKMSVITNNGASLVTALFAATGLITAYTPFIISAYWKLNDIKVYLNYANSKQTTTCPVGTATQAAPVTYLGNCATAAPLYTAYASPAGGLISNFAIWKDCHSSDEFHRILYYMWKDRLGRRAA